LAVDVARRVDGVSGILFSEALAAEGAIVHAKACELGLEGIVSKREGSLFWAEGSGTRTPLT
jgi:ATP-dependent DNA ligase